MADELEPIPAFRSCRNFITISFRRTGAFALTHTFEAPAASYGWVQNNWPKPANRVDFKLDRTNPHSGAFSQRISLLQVASVADLQLESCILALQPRTPLQLRFWTRGLPNTRPITVQLRVKNAPYTVYFQAEVSLTGNWSESVFNVTLPDKANTKNIVLLFDLHEVNTYWLDDVTQFI